MLRVKKGAEVADTCVLLRVVLFILYSGKYLYNNIEFGEYSDVYMCKFTRANLKHVYIRYVFPAFKMSEIGRD